MGYEDMGLLNSVPLITLQRAVIQNLYLLERGGLAFGKGESAPKQRTDACAAHQMTQGAPQLLADPASGLSILFSDRLRVFLERNKPLSHLSCGGIDLCLDHLFLSREPVTGFSRLYIIPYGTRLHKTVR
jgi:hypothetical protein